MLHSSRLSQPVLLMLLLSSMLALPRIAEAESTDRDGPGIDAPLSVNTQPDRRVIQNHLDTWGITVDLGLTLVGQIASDTVSGPSHVITGSYDIGATWTLPAESLRGKGTFGLLIEGGRNLTRSSAFDLSGNVGSTLGINDDRDDQQIALTELWYEHHLIDDRLMLTLGKIDQTVYFDANRIANDETNQFITSPLVNNAAIPFPDNGLGIHVALVLDEQWTIAAGYGDALAEAGQTGLNTFGEGHFVAGQITFSPTFGDDLEGAYRLLMFYNDPDGQARSGSGFGISIDQEIMPGLVSFFRYGYAEPGVSEFRHFVSAGLGLENPFGMTDDLLAVGIAWAEAEAGGDEWLIELLYRIQLTETLQLTPALIYIHDPLDGSRSTLIGSLRAQFNF